MMMMMDTTWFDQWPLNADRPLISCHRLLTISINIEPEVRWPSACLSFPGCDAKSGENDLWWVFSCLKIQQDGHISEVASFCAIALVLFSASAMCPQNLSEI